LHDARVTKESAIKASTKSRLVEYDARR